MATVSDIMTRDVFRISPEASGEDAAWALSARGISGAPVCDAAGHLLGVISRSDLTDPERAVVRGEQKVRELMTPALITLRASDEVMSAVALMVREEVHRVLVLDEDGELAGIVTPADVLRALLDGVIDDIGTGPRPPAASGRPLH